MSIDTAGVIAAKTNLAAADTDRSKSNEALSKFGEDFDDFLKLLVAQLENQDPTSPLETNEFTSQIVSFTGVEQAINTNQKLEELITMQANNRNSYLVSFSGKEVEVEGKAISMATTGTTRFSYEIPNETKESFIGIKNSTGNFVFNTSASKNAGRNEFVWDGLDNNGNRVTAGVYDISVSAESKTGVINEVKTLVRGIVSGVVLDKANPSLIVNSKEIPLDDVKFIGETTL